jgi:Flp pilus assembly protein TadG
VLFATLEQFWRQRRSARLTILAGEWDVAKRCLCSVHREALRPRQIVGVSGAMFRYPRAHSRTGTATVEFALVLPLLMSLLFGIIEFGFLFKDQLTLQQTAREGTRTAAVGKLCSEINDRIVASASTLTTANLTYDKMYRTYASGAWSSWTTLGDRTDTSGQNNAPQGAQIRVRTHYVHQFLTGSLFARLIGRPGATSMTLNAEMVMRRE